MNESEPLNLLNLAKAEPGQAKSALARGLSVQALTEPMVMHAENLWLVVLEGKLIVDLPHGDFRLLKVGDSICLKARVTLNPLEEAVFLFG